MVTQNATGHMGFCSTNTTHDEAPRESPKCVNSFIKLMKRAHFVAYLYKLLEWRLESAKVGWHNNTC